MITIMMNQSVIIRFRVIFQYLG